MLTQLRHCNVRIAAERVLLLLYTVTNAHVIARVSLLKDHSLLATESPRGGFVTTSLLTGKHRHTQSSNHLPFGGKKICNLCLWVVLSDNKGRENVHEQNTEKARAAPAQEAFAIRDKQDILPPSSTCHKDQAR